MWSWIVMHRAYFPDAQAQLPYVIAFVELAEGPMVMARITGADLACDAAVTFNPEQSATAGIAVFDIEGGRPSD
jgi:uncharacterized OB-fold protein